jgi:GTP-binding protein
VINRELALFDPRVAAKPQIVAANKIDAAMPESLAALRARFAARGIALWEISAATGAGVSALVREIWRHVQAARQAQAADAPSAETGDG